MAVVLKAGRTSLREMQRFMLVSEFASTTAVQFAEATGAGQAKFG